MSRTTKKYQPRTGPKNETKRKGIVYTSNNSKLKEKATNVKQAN